MLIIAFDNVSSLMIDRLAYFAFSSQVYRPDGGTGGGGGRAVGLEAGQRSQRPIAIN